MARVSILGFCVHNLHAVGHALTKYFDDNKLLYEGADPSNLASTLFSNTPVAHDSLVLGDRCI